MIDERVKEELSDGDIDLFKLVLEGIAFWMDPSIGSYDERRVLRDVHILHFVYSRLPCASPEREMYSFMRSMQTAKATPEGIVNAREELQQIGLIAQTKALGNFGDGLLLVLESDDHDYGARMVDKYRRELLLHFDS